MHLRVTLNPRNSAILRLRLVGLQPTPPSATSFNWWVGEADNDQAGFSRTSRLVFRHHHGRRSDSGNRGVEMVETGDGKPAEGRLIWILPPRSPPAKAGV